MVKQKRRLHKGAALALSLLLLLSLLAGCGGKPQEDASSSDGPTNTYIPPVNDDGYIVVTIPVTLMGGQTQEEIIENYLNDEVYINSSDHPTEHITDVTANEDGTVNYIFTPEQFINYKQDIYEAGRLKSVYGEEYPASIVQANYTDIDENGVPWAIVVSIDQEAFKENYIESLLFSTFWPATYLGKYQFFCGVPGDEWAVHVTVKDADTGEVISEHDFPTRGE